MSVIRAILISVLAALAGAYGGELMAGGRFDALGPAIFVSYFTLLGSLGLLAPGYAIMKFNDVPPLRRYIGVFLLGALAGAVILLPMDFATGRLESAPVGAWFGAITGAFWVLFHAISRAMVRRDRPTA